MGFSKLIVGLLVTAMLAGMSVCCAEAKLVLPAALKEIGAEAFLGVHADEIVLPDGVKRIESGAFSGSGTVVLPDSLEYIAPDAFGNAGAFSALINPGSYAHVWCIENGMPCRSMLAVGKKLEVRFSLDGSLYTAVESSDSAIAAVNSTGTVSGRSNGSCIVYAANDVGAIIEIPVDVTGYSAVHRALCVAHRGASGYYRENSITAFEHAQALDADIVELDVQKTKDGVIVVYHDKTIKTSEGKKYVSSLTWKALRKADSRICTLEQAIECIRQTDMIVMVEFKATGIVDPVIKIVEDGGMGNRVMYSGFDLPTLQQIEKIRPEVDTAWSINSAAGVKNVIASPEEYDVDIALVNHSYLTTETIRDLHLAGKGVYAWTVNTKSRIEECIQMGADGILTNYPDYM